MTGDGHIAKPLEGVKVVELSTYLAAPACGRILAYLGADVLKIEQPGGDPYRKQGLLYGVPVNDDDNPLYMHANAGKRFVGLDLKTEEGLNEFYSYVKDADVFITNLMDRSLDKLNIAYARLHAVNPALVYGRISGYGPKGPLAGKVGFDSTAYFARGGQMLDYVEPGTPPNNIMLGSGDCNTAMALAAGILTALTCALLHGEGSLVNASLLHTSIWMASMDYVISQYNENFFIDRVYRCKDGVYMYVQAITDKQKNMLLDIIGMTRGEYDDHFAAIPKLTKIYEMKTFDEWSAILDGTGVCIERLRHIHEVPFDEQALINGFMKPYGKQKKVNIPIPPILYDGAPEAFDADITLK